MKRSPLIAVTIATLCMASTAQADQMLVADFNAPAPNNLEGQFGSFAPSGSELVYICRESLDISDKRGGEGSSLRLDYNVSNGGAFNGFWMKLGPADSANNLDVSAYEKLTFWLKGDEKVGIPHKFKVELKGDPGEPGGQSYVTDVPSKWKKIEIPLKEFESQGVDLTRLNEMVIVFEQRAASPGMVGAILIDNVSFQ